MAHESRWGGSPAPGPVLLAATRRGERSRTQGSSPSGSRLQFDECSLAVGLPRDFGSGDLTCFAGAALAPDQRAAWTSFGLGLLFWTAGDLYWTLAYSDVNRTPYPSAADAAYLAALPCFYVGSRS